MGRHAPAHRRQLPSVVPQLLRVVKGGLVQPCKVIVLGFSRGGAWGLDLAREHAACLGAAVLIAVYPNTKHDEASLREARRLMPVPRPILLVHFAADSWCNADAYPWRFGPFETAPTNIYQYVHMQPFS